MWFLFFINVSLYGRATIYSSRDTQAMSVIDSGNVRISYAFNATNIKDYKTYDDLQLLEIGTVVSKYYSYFVFNSDSLITDFKLKKPHSSAVPSKMGIRGKDIFWSEYYYSEYYKENNTLTEYSRMPIDKMNVYYTEDLPIQEWEVDTDTLTVMDYICQKATCRFRGRDYVAWFAPDIPVNNGPWKFGGLPGLILKISDTENKYSYECIGIEQFKHKFPIKKYKDYKSRYKKEERTTVLKIQKKMNEDYETLAGITPVDLVNGKFVRSNRIIPKIKHDPIELE
jgi:GLPGLI family protein